MPKDALALDHSVTRDFYPERKAPPESPLDRMVVDALGNLIARKGQKASGGQRIMLSAHMDEIGVMATHIDENGFVRFTTIGGVRPHTCLGGRVRFVSGVSGMIGGERLESPDKVNTFEQLYIDVGAEDRWRSPARAGEECVDGRTGRNGGLGAQARDRKGGGGKADRLGKAMVPLRPRSVQFPLTRITASRAWCMRMPPAS